MKPIRNYLTGIGISLMLFGCMPQTTEGGKQGSSQGLFGPQIFILVAMILVFWLFFIRPQAKRAKNQKKFIEDLQRGDKIVTIAGIHGTVNKINDDGTLNIEISPGSYIKIEKSAIRLVSGVGFSNGCALLVLKNPPPFVPHCLMNSCDATGPCAISCSVWFVCGSTSFAVS